ncbi:MAG: hypothetical protein IJS99_04815 [Synergistaceae bacterium]|nr:hypothetical protein [Synergistaceae bacterium]
MIDKIRVAFNYFDVHDTDSLLTMLCIKDIKIADRIVLDNETPDYVIVSDRIYFKPEYEKSLRKILTDNNHKPILIGFMREAISPDLNIFDYAICWNWKFSYRDRVARIPPHIFVGDSKVIMPEMTNNLTQSEAKNLLGSKKRFCNFIYSNASADSIRKKIFDILSQYKRVESLGKYLNNVGTVISSSCDWQELSIKIKNHYKFSIACENASFDGYTSEKLLTSLQAHTVPIYWGNPYVSEEYNPEAFINVNDYNNIEDVVKRVKEIDEDDDLWAYIVSRPWQTDSQKKYSEQEYKNYQDFMTNIFSQPLDKARRVGSGTWPELFYKNWFLDRHLMGDTRFLYRLRRFIKTPSRLTNKIKKLTLPETDIDEFFNE